MRKYTDYQKDKTRPDKDLTKQELAKVEWTKYKIIVPTEVDKTELEEAFEHIHYSDIDTDFISVNQLAHEYLTEEREPGSRNNIIVDPVLYNQLINTSNDTK